MSSVALIGGDGAGKTTIANAVIQSSGLTMKYIYMGLSTRSSNYALPTSRLVLFLKQKKYKKSAQASGDHLPDDIPVSQLEYGKDVDSFVWNSLRFLNRLAEAWYRQIISLNYQMHSFIVLYDRHFFFDTAPGIIKSQDQKLLLLDRIFFWIINHLYPKPTLTIFLDAPPALLYQRKHEATPEYLEQQRHVYLRQGKKLSHFIVVDASQPIEQVISEVMQLIKEFFSGKHFQSSDVILQENIENK